MTDRVARLRDELESGRNVNGAWLDEDAEWLLAECERLRAARNPDETARRIATIRENVAHIARGCRASTAHNPAPYLNSIEAALVALGEADDE